MSVCVVENIANKNDLICAFSLKSVIESAKTHSCTVGCIIFYSCC